MGAKWSFAFFMFPLTISIEISGWPKRMGWESLCSYMTLIGPFPFWVLCFPVSSPEDLDFLLVLRKDCIRWVCPNCSDKDGVFDDKKEKSLYFDVVGIVLMPL